MSKKLNKIIIGLFIVLTVIIGTTQSVKASTEKMQNTIVTKEIEGELKKVRVERKIKWNQMDLKLDEKSAKITYKKSPEKVIVDETKSEEEKPQEGKTEVKKADISVEKSSEVTKLKENKHSDIVEYGDTIKYIIKITNKGNDKGSVTIKDTLPKGTTLLEYNSNITNLTQEEYKKLASNEGLSKDLEVEAESTKTIEFTVKVTGVAGTKITNTVKYKTPEKEESTKDPIEYLIGKEVKITKNTENIKTTNSNIVLVIDVSGSMAENSRLKNAKEAAKKLINGVDFTSGGQIGIVTFSSGKKTNGQMNWNEDNAQALKVSSSKEYATNSQDAISLKNNVENLKADGGTRIAAGLLEAKTMIEKMAFKNPKNKNVIIVLSDGDYSVDKYRDETIGDELKNSGKETVSRVTTKANALKNSTAKPSVYTIAVLAANETPGNTSIMTEIIPSSKENYIKATDGYTNLISAFKKIESSISGGATKSVVSKDGIVELDEIKSIESVVIKVNGQKISNTKNYLKLQNSKTFIDLNAFDSNAKIEVEYMAN